MRPPRNTIAMPPQKSQSGKRMWPFSFSDMSLETANWWSDVANMVLVVSLVAGVAATFVVVRTGNVKEAFWDKAREEAKSELAKTSKAIAEANERAAEANRKAEEEKLARVKIEEKLAPRQLSDEQKNKIGRMLSEFASIPGTGNKQKVSVFSVSGSFESQIFAQHIVHALTIAGWNVDEQPVTYGMSYTLLGVGILLSNNPRAENVAKALIEAFSEERVFVQILPKRRPGCEEQGQKPEQIAKDPWCSAISILVGDHP